MAKHEVKPYANKLSSKAKWPFLGNYIPKNSLTLDGIISDLAKEAGGTETQAKAILEGAFDILEQLETEGLVRYNLPGGFAVGPVIRGAFPASNSPWNPEVNKLELSLSVDAAIRNELAGQTVVIVTDETVTKAYVHRMVDIAAPAPDNLIHGTHRFRVQGKKMILLADNPPYLKNSYGTRFELVIDNPGDGQNFEAHSAELLEGGDYRLCVPTKAGEDDGIDQCPSKPVKYLKVEDPYLAKSPDGLSTVRTLNGKDSLDKLEPVSSGSGFTLTGDGLARYVGASPFLVWGEGDDEKVQVCDFEQEESGAISSEIGSAEAVLPVGTTTCHLTFGDGDEAIDIGPFKVTREA